MSKQRAPQSPPPSPGDDAAAAGRTQVRGSSLLFAGQVFAILVNLAAQLLVVRYLSKDGYGVFAYVLSVVAIGQALAAFGIRHGVSRFLPLYEERDEPAKAAGTLAFGLGVVGGVGALVAVGVLIFKGQIAAGVESGDAASLLVIMIALAPLFAIGTVLDGTLAVFARSRAIALRRYVLVPGLRLAAVGLLIASGSGVIFLAWAYLVVELLGILVYGPLLVPLLRERGLLSYLRPSRWDPPVREVLGFSGPLFTNDITGASLNAAGAVIVGALAGAADVASLRAVLPVVLTMGYVLASFGMLFLPLASRLHARGADEGIGPFYWQTATWTTVLAYPIFATAVLLAEPVTVLLFGERYASSGSVLAVLALGQFVNTAAGHNGVILSVFGRTRLILATNALAIALNLVLAFVLVPEHGALGAAIAFTCAYVALNGVRQYGLVRYTPIAPVDPAYLRAIAAALVATGAALALQVALGPPIALRVALTLAACACVYASARRTLRLTETFPEIAGLPLLRSRPGAPSER